MRRLVIGTRGSDLARAQTAMVEEAIRRANPDVETTIEIITTSGDQGARARDADQGLKGLFTREIERSLLEGKIDVAVHSAKDLPSEATPGLTIAAVLPRAAVEDVLVAKATAELPQGATVATGSVRRQHQLRLRRPDLNIVELRGNVPTRLRKLMAEDWDAIVLARAGLERLGLNCGSAVLEFEGAHLAAAPLPTVDFLPAGGQGIIAIQMRSDDAQALGDVDHRETHLCLRAEREFLRLLQGDCGTPVGVLATIDDEQMNLRAQVFEGPEAKLNSGATLRNPLTREPEVIAKMLFSFMYAQSS